MRRGLVSFVIPARNSGATIGDCVRSVRKQKCRSEVIVVDGRSEDDTREIAGKAGARVLTDGGGRISTARNAGLRAASGEYIAFVDSDVVLPEGWCRKALGLIRKDKGLAAVGGPGISPEKGMVAGSLNSLLYGRSSSERRYVSSLATMDALYRRAAIGAMLFDSGLETGEDPEFNMRLVKEGWRLLLSPELRVWHRHPVTLGGLLGKWYNYGRNYPKMCTRHREFRGLEFYARVLYMPALIASAALALAWPPAVLVPVMQSAALYIAYLWKGIRAGFGPRSFAFACIHWLKQNAQLLGTLAGLRKLL